MKMTVNERDHLLNVTLVFPDSRVVDLDSALHLASNKRWVFSPTEKKINVLEQKISRGKEFLVLARFTHGLEPPTRVLFENKEPETGHYRREKKQDLIEVVTDFLEECAGRGLVSQAQKDKAVAELKRHDKVEV